MLCRTYTISNTTNCGSIARSSPSSAFASRAFAESRCLSFRWTMNERKTFASTATRCTSDASSALPCLFNDFHDVGRAFFDEAFPPVERRAVGGDGDFPAADLPRKFVSWPEVEGVADFLRDGRLSLAGDRRCRHGVCVFPSQV